MGLVAWIKRLFGARDAGPLPEFDPGAFLFIVIRDAMGPLDRGVSFEEPIDAALRARELGRVTGGGSQLGERRPDGTQTIAWCGIDVDLAAASKREGALELLRDELRRLGVPVGSELHYTAAGVRLLDRLDADGWRLREAREALHPGFGC